MSREVILCVIAAIVFIVACKRSDSQSQSVYEGFVKPAHFPDPVYTFKNNPLTKEGFELGRKLFYDTRLSVDSSISCGTCHGQLHAFADHGVAKSVGVFGRKGTRNSPSLSNLAWYPQFMWDGGINHIEVMPIAPITNPLEMDETFSSVVQKLQSDPEYVAAFKSAFGTEKIDDQKILFALTQFMGMMISATSKYDDVKSGKKEFTAEEEKGYQIFKKQCASCHREPLFTDFSYRNNGLDEVFTDSGRALITQKNEDMGRFKVPSLRNVMITYPYMHDGRFFTINGVLDHYISGVKDSPTLDPQLKSTVLKAEDKQAIIAFLNTLTDFNYLADDRFSEK